MATEPKGLRSMDTNERDNVAMGTPEFIATDPAKLTAIGLDKAGSNGKVEVSSDARLSGGLKITDFEAAGILFFEVSASNTTDYFAGDSTLITCVKLTNIDNGTPMEYSVTQKGTG